MKKDSIAAEMNNANVSAAINRLLDHAALLSLLLLIAILYAPFRLADLVSRQRITRRNNASRYPFASGIKKG